jgi:hypothetical protein
MEFVYYFILYFLIFMFLQMNLFYLPVFLISFGGKPQNQLFRSFILKRDFN